MQAWGILYTAVAFLFIEGCMIFLALNNEHDFLGFATSTQNASRLYWGTGVVLLVFFIIFLRKSIRQRKQGRKIILTEDAIILPSKPSSNNEVTIHFRDILSVNRHTADRSSLSGIEIKHERGKVSVNEMFLDSKQLFNELYTILQRKVRK